MCQYTMCRSEPTCLSPILQAMRQLNRDSNKLRQLHVFIYLIFHYRCIGKLFDRQKLEGFHIFLNHYILYRYHRVGCVLCVQVHVIKGISAPVFYYNWPPSLQAPGAGKSLDFEDMGNWLLKVQFTCQVTYLQRTCVYRQCARH